MPPLDRGTLTFGSVSRLLRDLFDLGSQGAYEQFAIASLLSALIEQTAQDYFKTGCQVVHIPQSAVAERPPKGPLNRQGGRRLSLQRTSLRQASENRVDRRV